MKILIIGPSWVGDMVMAQSLFISLKQIVPDVKYMCLLLAGARLCLIICRKSAVLLK